jgi:hypothetical protein
MMAAVGVLLALAAAPASAQVTSPHSDNMTLLANWTLTSAEYQGSDMAFWGDRVVLGSYSGPGGFNLLDISNPAAPRLTGVFDCDGTQADVSIWKKLVIVSVDSPRGATAEDGSEIEPTACGAQAASQTEIEEGSAWEGLRIVSIADPRAPRQLAALATDCGSHTHTLVPDEAHGRLIAYVQSYPLGAPSPSCNVASHRKVSVVEIPLADPAAAKVIGAVDVSPNIGCHDVTVFLPRKLAGLGCISESQIWDISDPAKPKVIAHIPNPRNNIHHSTAFSWDGNVLVLGDELGGAEAAPSCNGTGNGGFGGLWFYDIKNPEAPVLKGNYTLPQTVDSTLCTAHLFNPIPLRSEKNILVSSWYEGGLTVVDFTDPSAPKQVGFYIPSDPAYPGDENPKANMWSAYWYNGHAYANNHAARGFDVFTLDLPELAAEIPLERLNPQIQEPLPPPVPPTGPAKGRCTERQGFKLRLKRPRRLRSAVFFVGGRRARVVRGKALRRPVRLRRLPAGRVRIDITATTKKGRRISFSRRYRFCR